MAIGWESGGPTCDFYADIERCLAPQIVDTKPAITILQEVRDNRPIAFASNKLNGPSVLIFSKPWPPGGWVPLKSEMGSLPAYIMRSELARK